MSKPFYLTTTLPYVNGDPHIGFALEIIRADFVVRMKKLAGYDVFFNTGTDEHGVKIFRKATELGMNVKDYVDMNASKFKELLPKLNISSDINFIRTTDEHHILAAQTFWDKVKENGEKAKDGPYIYKKNYSVKYCPGCELEKTESELIDNKCPLHPLQDIEIIEEENYFFKFSAFQEKLLELYEKNKGLVVPSTRLNEIKAFVQRGLQDFSISRVKEKMPWGIPVPNDPSQVMYVWFDALVNYVSAIGWPCDESDSVCAFDKYWIESGGVVQYCGKDNLRQQAAMWQAMLMACGLPASKTIVIDGFITGEGGIKMSKSLGNTVDPFEIVTEYGSDALRYYVCREISSFEDSPFTMAKFKEAYNAGLANGIGNLTSRVLKMSSVNNITVELDEKAVDFSVEDNLLAGFEIDKYCDRIWKHIEEADKYIASKQPFKVIKENKAEGEEMIKYLLKELWIVGLKLRPFLPETAKKIERYMVENKPPDEPLFARR